MTTCRVTGEGGGMVLCSEVVSGFQDDGEQDCGEPTPGCWEWTLQGSRGLCCTVGDVPIFDLCRALTWPKCKGCGLRVVTVEVHALLGHAQAGVSIVRFRWHGNQHAERREIEAAIRSGLHHLYVTDGGVCE